MAFPARGMPEHPVSVPMTVQVVHVDGTEATYTGEVFTSDAHELVLTTWPDGVRQRGNISVMGQETHLPLATIRSWSLL